MELTPITAAQAEALARLHATSFGEAAWPAADIWALACGPGGYGVAAQGEAGESGQPAGFILCRQIAGEAEVLTLAVAPERRREGLGAALIEAAAGLARSAGAESLFLEVAEDNHAAIGLYQRAGFEPAGRRRGYYVQGRARAVDALVYRRVLNSAAP